MYCVKAPRNSLQLISRILNFKPTYHISSRIQVRHFQKSFGLQVPRWRTAVTALRGDNHKVDVDEAKNFVFLLEPIERELILKELQSFQEELGKSQVSPSPRFFYVPY